MTVAAYKVQTETAKYLQRQLRDYPYLKQRIALAREEVLFPFSADPDENIGGGRSSYISNPTQQKVVQLVTNEKLIWLMKMEQSIREVVETLPHEKLELVQLKYWDKPVRYNWNGIADKLHIGRNTALRWNAEIIGNIAERLGLE
jgi:RinA family phage transcriptional activator